MFRNQIMNKSEVQNKFHSKESNSGWICPKCGKVNSPSVKFCSCSSAKQESKTQQKNWICD